MALPPIDAHGPGQYSSCHEDIHRGPALRVDPREPDHPPPPPPFRIVGMQKEGATCPGLSRQRDRLRSAPLRYVAFGDVTSPRPCNVTYLNMRQA